MAEADVEHALVPVTSDEESFQMNERVDAISIANRVS